MQKLFAWNYGNRNNISEVSEVIEKIDEIDPIITRNAPKWPLDKINKIDLSILRYASWELLFHQDTPPKVVIDEAIEIAKEYGTESSPSFVNAVLGSIVKDLNLIVKNDSKPTT
ncbi:MAG: transcription antitermination factor NusB [Patescibacteria group bacterium]|jgi:N utilization substance protein B